MHRRHALYYLAIFLLGLGLGGPLDRWARHQNIDAQTARDTAYTQACEEALAFANTVRSQGGLKTPARVRLEFDTPSAVFQVECDNSQRGNCRMTGEERPRDAKR